MSDEKGRSNTGKIIAVIAIIIFVIFILPVVVFVILWSHDDSQEYHYTTAYGDSFTVRISYPGKITLSNAECRFGYGLNDWQEGDQIIPLCDTSNLTCYKVQNLTICKLKTIHQMIVMETFHPDSNKEAYNEMQRILLTDDAARQYIKLPDVQITSTG